MDRSSFRVFFSFDLCACFVAHLVKPDASEQPEMLFFGLCSQPAGPWASVGAGARKQPVPG